MQNETEVMADNDAAEPDRPSFTRALAGYDPKFRRALTSKIIETITKASIVADANVCAIRTGETADALVDCLVFSLSLSPSMDVPSDLRLTAEHFAKRLRREVARARANGVGDILGGGKGGARMNAKLTERGGNRAERSKKGRCDEFTNRCKHQSISTSD
jgi:hypothetical protein